MTLAADHGPAPMNIAAILLLDRGADLDLAMVTEALRARIPAVPRLRERMVPTPLGCGRPVWLDDPGSSWRGTCPRSSCRHRGPGRACSCKAV
jgi:diacylglycerol O-acyltransferase / wax synthase